MEKLSRKEQNVKIFLNSALNNFTQFGIYDAKVSAIASDVGLTERSAYRYFPTKASMVKECLKLLWHNYMLMANEAYLRLDCDDKDTICKIKLILMEYAKLFLNNKNELLFVTEAEAYLTRCNISIYDGDSFPLNLKDRGSLKSIIDEGIRNNDILDNEETKLLYFNCFDSLLGFMEKLVIESYNNKITDDEAIKRLDLFTTILAKGFKK